MLKVVGASTEQTRFTIIGLGIVIFISILAIIFYEVPLPDGFYAATVYWSKSHSFSISYWGQNNDPESVLIGAARGYYKEDEKNTGWATLEIQTGASYPDWVQAYAAGYLEGGLCWQMIYWHWQNTVVQTCNGREEFCEKVRKQLEENEIIVKSKSEAYDKKDPFWHQVHLFYVQLEGLEQGFRSGLKSNRIKHLEIPHIDFLWMNSASDLRDLSMAHNAPQDCNPNDPVTSLAFLKYNLSRPTDFLLSHSTAGFYSHMLRIQKKYEFNFHLTRHRKSLLVNGKTAIFTSYPGVLHSQDDFYQTYGAFNMTVAGLSLANYNLSLWNSIDMTTVLMAPRIMAANRVAKSAEEWSSYVSKYNSGTGNKQWFVIESLNSGPKFSLLEQLPGLTQFENMTRILHIHSYWVSYGVAYFEDIKQIAGHNENYAFLSKLENLSEFFKKRQGNITNDSELFNMMRHPELVALGRSDILGSKQMKNKLETVDGVTINKKNIKFFRSRTVQEETYEECAGIIDIKIALGQNSFKATAGPLYTTESASLKIEPFQWSKSSINHIPHMGQADVWDFDPVRTTWVW